MAALSPAGLRLADLLLQTAAGVVLEITAVILIFAFIFAAAMLRETHKDENDRTFKS